MGILDRLRGEKKAEARSADSHAHSETITEFRKFLVNDNEVFEALRRTMPLNPRKIEVSMKEAARKAMEFEKQGDTLRARVWYEVAGGLAIYRGNVEKVGEFFRKCSELSPNIDYPILENTEKAVQKAQEYYKKHLKSR